MRRAFLLILLLGAAENILAQTLGGATVFNFLKNPTAPQLSALGGINVSQLQNDLAMGFHQPAFYTPGMHGQTSFNFQTGLGGVKQYQASGVYYDKKRAVVFAGGIQFLDYGNLTQTTDAGIELGTIRPTDYMMQLSVSRSYMSRWRYGLNLKWIQSSYGQYRSNGLALDAGLTYTDTARKWQAGILLRHMGTQLKVYQGSSRAGLPFDIQAGISKRLLHAPLQFSATLHHLHQFNIQYADSTTDGMLSTAGGFTDKVFRHVVLAAQLFIEEKIEWSLGYNYLRRKELNIGNSGNGLNGFSMGLGIHLRKFQFRYTRVWLQQNQSLHQIGMNLALSRPFR